MPSTEQKSFTQIARALHRDIGWFTAGLTLIFVLSGIAQVYRDSDFLQHEIQVPVQVDPGLQGEDIGRALRVREFKAERTEGSVTFFRGGSYDAATGKAVRTQKEFVFPLDRFSELHKQRSKEAWHWITLAYGALLGFMAISSFFMFKGGSPMAKRGLVLAGLGFAVALAVVFLATGS